MGLAGFPGEKGICSCYCICLSTYYKIKVSSSVI
jgi:hypothetical protein